MTEKKQQIVVLESATVNRADIFKNYCQIFLKIVLRKYAMSFIDNWLYREDVGEVKGTIPYCAIPWKPGIECNSPYKLYLMSLIERDVWVL